MEEIKKYRNHSILLLEKFNLNDSFPINIDKLAKELNINVIYQELEPNVSGKISYNPLKNETLIKINNQEHEFRQRFSLAHEIAHYIYDIDFNEFQEIEDTITHFRAPSNNPIERRADKYAERLLMPANLFRAKTKELKEEMFPNTGKTIGYKNIYKIVIKLSEDFRVSRPAIIFRLNSLKIINEKTKKELFDYHYL